MYSQIDEWKDYLSREDELIEQHLGKAVVLLDGKVQHLCDGNRGGRGLGYGAVR